MVKKYKLHILLVILLFTAIILPMAYGKYTESKTKYITINSRDPEYSIVFNANAPTGATATGSMSNQNFTYGVADNLSPNNFAVSGYFFDGWTTSADGTGTVYVDEELVNNLSQVDGDVINLYANWVSGVAEVNGTNYTTLQAAINAVPANTLTTVRLLANVTEDTIVNNNKIIFLDLRNHTLTALGGSAAITNNGQLTVSNGTVVTNSTATATLDNKPNATLVIDGVRVLMTATGGKQAIYNDKGTVEIKGNSYIRSVSGPGSNLRATVQNQPTATLIITGGTIISDTYLAVDNKGTMTIGVEDNASNKLSPIFQGGTIGVSSSTDFAFYDGTAKGKNSAFNNISKITSKEDGFMIVNHTEEIDGETYKTAYLGLGITITFNAASGTSSEASRIIESGASIGPLPSATRSDYQFDGWFTLAEGGVEVTASTTFDNSTTIFAHWSQNGVASVNGTLYTSLQTAINSASNGSTIRLLNDCIANANIPKNKTLTLDLNGHTLSNSGNVATITNNGTLEVYNGTVTGNASTNATINNKETGRLYISGGNIISTGTRSAVYNVAGGYVEVSGTAYLSSTASGTPTDSTLERGTIHNLQNGTVKITGGTIVGINQQAISNEGNLTIGDNTDNNINITSPEIRGKTYGIKSAVPFTLYDGIVKGITNAIYDEVNSLTTDSSYSVVHGTEIVESNNYETLYLTE